MRRKIILWEIGNFVAFFYCVFVSMNRQTEYGLFLLPLVYSILFSVCYRSRRLIGKAPGVTVIMGVMFCRYVVLPVVLCSSGELSKYANDYRYMVQAVVIMLYEMFAIFMALEMTAIKAWRTHARQYEQNKNNIAVKPPFLVVLIIFCALAGIYLTNQSILNGNSTNANKRRRLIEEGIKEEKCECCGLSEWMGKPIPLELHHKDFNHYNNSLENLQILCSNCHMQAHNYCNTKK